VKTHAAAVALALAFGVAGCGDDSGKSADAPAKEQAAPDPGALAESDFPKGEWPLTVSEGVVRCEGSAGSGSVIFRAPDGTDYAVNGTAKTVKQDLPEIEEIWKKDPDVPGARINISPVSDRGLELCE
jgi:hypothetical protein